ncbi:MAG: tetratricopeptide repeat protein, partial [Gemmatimonadales bacterium]
IAGEKRFRFTVVPDSAGVLTLPAVSYPYFDPAVGTVRPAIAGALSLPIRPRVAASGDRQAPLVTADAAVPIASRVVRSIWPLLLILAALAPLLALWRRRRIRRRAPISVAPPADPEAALRRALGTPVAAGPDRVVASLRARGVPRDDAEHILRWLSAAGRRRYGPSQAPPPEVPPAVTRALARLLRGAALTGLVLVAATLHAEQENGIARYQGHDYVGAVRAFQSVVDSEPAAAGAWLDLGAARWMDGEDVAAAAAWIRALELAPRDPLIRSAWGGAVTIPADVRGLAPAIPASRDELLLLSLAFWFVLCAAMASSRRRLVWAVVVPFVACATLALARTRTESTGRALVTDNTVLRISPHPAMAPIGEVPQWAQVQIERRDRGWALISLSGSGASGLLGSGTVEGWVPATSLVEIRPGVPTSGPRTAADR